MKCAPSIVVALVWGICPLYYYPVALAGRSVTDRDEESLAHGIHFRRPAMDGLNCLYLQLRLLGYTGTYERFLQELPAEPGALSLASLVAVAKRFGFALTPVKLVPSELAMTGSPVIVHFEETGIGKGRFHVFLGMSDDEAAVALINGAYVTRHWMPRDEFRRNWTGYALVARPPFAWQLWIRRSVVVLVIGCLGKWLARQVGSHLSPRPGRQTMALLTAAGPARR